MSQRNSWTYSWRRSYGLAACAPDSGAKNGANGGGVFTTVDANNPITPGKPMNPYSPNGNTFLSYNSMRLGFEKKNPMDANDAFPGLAKSWEIKGDTLVAHMQPTSASVRPTSPAGQVA
ncbi:hypothetical protein [Streptomyces sp. 061-3]|uniref:hypothetical protein n=1 Tax=Streptomyces sp. 061-3 TaxID=2789268 RepID=UPI00397EDD02